MTKVLRLLRDMRRVETECEFRENPPPDDWIGFMPRGLPHMSGARPKPLRSQPQPPSQAEEPRPDTSDRPEAVEVRAPETPERVTPMMAAVTPVGADTVRIAFLALVVGFAVGVVFTARFRW